MALVVSLLAIGTVLAQGSSNRSESPIYWTWDFISQNTDNPVGTSSLVRTDSGISANFNTGGLTTEGVVRHSLIDGTELAGVFLHAINPDGAGSSNSQLRGAAHANRLTNVGLHPILFIWAFPNGIGNDSHAEFTENIVDSSNIFGITIEGLGFSGVPAQDNTASFRIEGGRLEGRQGLTMLTFGDGGDNSNNCIAGQVEGLTIKNGEPAVKAFLAPDWGNGNKFLFEMMDSIYSGKRSPGEVIVTDDAGNDFQIVGTPEEFLDYNRNFDISDVLLDFTGDRDLC